MSHQDGSVHKILTPRPLAAVFTLICISFDIYFQHILFWCETSLAASWAASVWWMMPEMEEDVFIFSWLFTCRPDWIGLPLFTSSFDVILHCEPAFHGPGLPGHSSIGLKQLCTLCAMRILSKQWVPIQISAFHHSPCLFTSFFNVMFFGSFLSVSGLFSLQFSL